MSTKLTPQVRAEAEIKAQLGDTSAQAMLKPSKDGNSMPPPQFSLESSTLQKAENPEFPKTTVPESGRYWEAPGTFGNPGFVPPLYEQGQGDGAAIHYNDVQQGALDDCYVLAAVAAIAHSRPDLIQNLIQPLGNNMYKVTLYKKNFWTGDYTAHTYEVEGTFPGVGGYVGAGPGDKKEIWVMLLEKAFAIHYNNSYRSFDGGGNSVNPMSEMMGSQAEEFNLASVTPIADIKNLIISSVQSGTPVVLGTPGLYRMPGRAEEADKSGLVKGHAYAVVGADDSSLTLYNPQGSASEADKGPEVTIGWGDVKKFFSRLVVG